jgi:hypothetical protein
VPSDRPPLAPVPVERSPDKVLHATLKPFIYDELDIDTPVQRAPLRVAIGGIRMGGAKTGWCKDPPHWNTPMVAKVICHGGSTILTELLIGFRRTAEPGPGVAEQGWNPKREPIP